MYMLIKPNTIFVSIASYRDELCTKTLESMFSNAENPSLVYAGICQQNSVEDNECVDNLNDIIKNNTNNIKLIRIPHYEARGPTYARYLCSTLWNGEEYFLQIDSHTLFAKNWDTKCIQMINEIKESQRTPEKKIILSHYPKNYDDITKDNEEQSDIVPRICKSLFNDRGMISFEGAREMSIEKNNYIQVPYLTGGFFFTTSNFLQEVPFDPHLDFLFVGEEISHSIRAWTTGFDIYTPTQNIVYHYYTRKDDPKIWTDKSYRDDDAFNKVKKLLKLDENASVPAYIQMNIDKYGLGTTRTLQDYYIFAGIDTNTKNVNKNFCDNTYEDPKSHTIGTFNNQIKLIGIIAVIFLIVLYLFMRYLRTKRTR